MKLTPFVKVYKIRDTKTGLFSEGGYNPRFTKEGKTWLTRRAIKAHLTQLSSGFRYFPTGKYDQVIATKDVPESWEIVEYTLSLTHLDTFSALQEQKRPAKK